MTRMERSEAVAQMRALCNEIGGTVTRLHPLVPRLAEPTAQGEILKALFGLTKELEVVSASALYWYFLTAAFTAVWFVVYVQK